MYYIFKTEIIKTKSGNYEIISYKKHCSNQVKFVATQISIIYQGRNYYAYDKLEFLLTNYSGEWSYGNIETERISSDLREIGVYAYFSPGLKKQYNYFKKHIENLPLNEFRRG